VRVKGPPRLAPKTVNDGGTSRANLDTYEYSAIRHSASTTFTLCFEGRLAPALACYPPTPWLTWSFGRTRLFFAI
jgi:hypothetical protein